MVTDEQFVEMIKAAPLGDGDLAEALSVSIPTIGRWKAGENLPHQAMRGPVERFLTGEVGQTVHRVGCLCGFCKAGFTRI